jgi:hypothetical protein
LAGILVWAALAQGWTWNDWRLWSSVLSAVVVGVAGEFANSKHDDGQGRGRRFK